MKKFKLSPEAAKDMAFCGMLTGPGNLRAHAALNNMPLPGSPHPKSVIQPLTLVILTHAKTSDVKQPNTPPATSPWKASVMKERLG